jgi:hypothetical protein
MGRVRFGVVAGTVERGIDWCHRKQFINVLHEGRNCGVYIWQLAWLLRRKKSGRR